MAESTNPIATCEYKTCIACESTTFLDNEEPPLRRYMYALSTHGQF